MKPASRFSQNIHLIIIFNIKSSQFVKFSIFFTFPVCLKCGKGFSFSKCNFDRHTKACLDAVCKLCAVNLESQELLKKHELKDLGHKEKLELRLIPYSTITIRQKFIQSQELPQQRMKVIILRLYVLDKFYKSIFRLSLHARYANSSRGIMRLSRSIKN